MEYKTKEQFIQHKGIRKLGLVEYIKGLESKGLSQTEVQAELLKNIIQLIVLLLYLHPSDN